MTTSKFLVLTALGIWLVTTLVVAVPSDMSLLGFPILLLVPFLAIPADMGMSLGWSATIACCIAVAWLVAAVEIWRRPKTRLAWCLFVVWNTLLIIGYYSLYNAFRDL